MKLRHLWPLVFLVVYFPVLLGHLVDIDYAIVIDQLRSFKSISDYFNKQFLVLDLQPIRDISLIIDIWIENQIEYQTFGVVNLILWCSSVFIIMRIFAVLDNKINLSYLVIILFGLHPIASWVISWPTARKHLLALVFILLATKAFIQYTKKAKGALACFIYYLLALNSQPIILFWPLCLIVYLEKDIFHQKYKGLVVLLLLAMGLYGVLNLYYYSIVYPMQTMSTKITESNFLGFSIVFLSISRSMAQILVPIKFASSYWFQNPWNLIGFPLFTIIFYFTTLKYNLKQKLKILIYMFFPFFTVYSSKTNVFMSDCYLIFSLASITILLCFHLKNKNYQFNAKPLLICLIFIFAAKSHYEVTVATDEESYFKVSYQREKDCRNKLNYANYLLFNIQLEKLVEVGESALGSVCLLSGKNISRSLRRLYVLTIFLGDKLSLDQKFQSLKDIKNPDIIELAVLANINKKKSNNEYFDKLQELLVKINLSQKNEKLINAIIAF